MGKTGEGRVELYAVGSHQSHANGDPTTLAGAKDECFFDAEGVHYLDVHDRRVPVREVLSFGASLSVPEKFDCQEIHCGGELLVLVLAAVESGGCLIPIGIHEVRVF